MSLFGTINFKKSQLNTSQTPNIYGSSYNINSSNIYIPNTSAINNKSSSPKKLLESQIIDQPLKVPPTQIVFANNKNIPQHFNN